MTAASLAHYLQGLYNAKTMGMYDKLGQMLNEFLETGALPPLREKKIDVEESAIGVFKQNQRQRELPPVPDYLLGDFYALGFYNLAKTPRFAQIKKRYRALAKARHPDTKKKSENQRQDEKSSALGALVESYRKIAQWYETAVPDSDNA
jgi:hypothetical protein